MRAPLLTFKRARRLRLTMTEPERMLWALLRGKRVGELRFRRQHPVGPYILDFYCPSAKLCIEIDGLAHAEPKQIEHDARRESWLKEQNIRIRRFSSVEILSDRRLTKILDAILLAAADC
jgi:very-short-patch-repair endonuclease